MTLDTETLYRRQRQYRHALGLGDQPCDNPYAATGGVCAPLSPIYQLHVMKIAAAFDVPPELILPIPRELPGGP